MSAVGSWQPHAASDFNFDLAILPNREVSGGHLLPARSISRLEETTWRKVQLLGVSLGVF